MSENDLKIQSNLLRIFEIYKSAGIFDEGLILENISYCLLLYHLQEEKITHLTLRRPPGQLGKLTQKFIQGELRSVEFQNLLSDLEANFSLVITQLPSNQKIPKFENQLSENSQREVVRLLWEVFENITDLGQWFNEYLIPRLDTFSKGGKYATPRYLAKFMAKISKLHPDNSIADFACGTGGMLVANGELKKVTGVEISINMARLAFTNLILHNQKHNLHLGNAFEVFTRSDFDEKFDVVLMNPPWGIKIDPYVLEDLFHTKAFFFNFKGTSETMFTALAYERLNPGGRMAIMVPSGMLFANGRGETDLRRYLLHANALNAVISLPHPISNVSTHILFATKPKKISPPDKNVWFYRPLFDGFSDGKNPRPIEENHLPLVQAACTAITEPSGEVQISPLFSDEEKVLGYAVHSDDANLSFKVRALGSDYLVDVSNKSETTETIYINGRKVYRGGVQKQEFELDVFKETELEGEFSLSSLSGDLLDEKTKYSLRLKKGKGEIRKGLLPKARFAGKTKEDVSAVGILLDSSNRVISDPIPLAMDKFGKSEERIGFALTEKDSEKPIAFLLIFSESITGIPLSRTNGRETVFLCHSEFDPKINLFYDPKTKKFSWSIRVMVDQKANVSFEDGEIFHSDQIRTGVVFDTNSVIVGVYVNRQEILNSKTAELQSERYWVEKQQAVVTRPTAEILGEIKKKQNRLTGILDQLLSISEIQALAGSELPPRLKMSESPAQNLKGVQQFIWKVVQTQTEQANGYATPKPFQSDDIKAKLTENVSIKDKDIQSTLELFERMGLIVAVSYEGVPYFRLPEERDWVAGEQA